MRPALAEHNQIDVLLDDAKAFADLALRKARPPQAQNLPHILFGEFGAAGFGAEGRAALSDHIRGIVGLRPEKQMIGIAARRNIATMADTERTRITFAEEHPSHSVNQPRSGLSIGADSHFAVSEWRDVASPQPAAAVRVVFNFLKKTAHDRALGRWGSAPLARGLTATINSMLNLISHRVLARLFGQVPARRANGWSGPKLYHNTLSEVS